MNSYTSFNELHLQSIVRYWEMFLTKKCNSKYGTAYIRTAQLNAKSELVIVYTDQFAKSEYNLYKKIINAFCEFQDGSSTLPLPVKIAECDYQLVIDKEIFLKFELNRVTKAKAIERSNAELRSIEDKKLAESRKILIEEMQALPTYALKEIVFLRFVRGDIAAELSEAGKKLKPCNLYVPGVKQELTGTSTVDKMRTQKAAEGLLETSIALVIDPFHPKTRLQYWAKVDASSDIYYVTILQFAESGISQLHLNKNEFSLHGAKLPLKIHINPLNAKENINQEFIRDFINKLVSIEMRRRNVDNEYFTSKGKMKSNIFKGTSSFHMHNEGGIYYAAEAIQGIFIQNINNKEAILHALSTKDQLLEILNRVGIKKDIYFLVMENGFLMKLDEALLHNNLTRLVSNQMSITQQKVIEELNNLPSAKNHGIKWSIIGSNYGFSTLNDSLRESLTREFTEKYGLVLDKALIIKDKGDEPIKGRLISCEELNFKIIDIENNIRIRK